MGVEDILGCSQEPRVRRSEQIAHQLKRSILEGGLVPGRKMPTEAEMCEHFHVSRTTLREAIQMLRVSGLVDVTPGRGSFITLPKLENILQDVAIIVAHSDENNSKGVGEVIEVLLSHALTAACSASTDKRKSLQKFMLNSSYTPKQNLEIEDAWLVRLCEISTNLSLPALVKPLLSINSKKRLQLLDDNSEIIRLATLQLKLNTSVLEGDLESAKRNLLGYLK